MTSIYSMDFTFQRTDRANNTPTFSWRQRVWKPILNKMDNENLQLYKILMKHHFQTTSNFSILNWLDLIEMTLSSHLTYDFLKTNSVETHLEWKTIMKSSIMQNSNKIRLSNHFKLFQCPIDLIWLKKIRLFAKWLPESLCEENPLLWKVMALNNKQ